MVLRVRDHDGPDCLSRGALNPSDERRGLSVGLTAEETAWADGYSDGESSSGGTGDVEWIGQGVRLLAVSRAGTRSRLAF